MWGLKMDLELRSPSLRPCLLVSEGRSLIRRLAECEGKLAGSETGAPLP